MDRNNVSANNHVRVRQVALRKESVDRNLKDSAPALLPAASLSARRAWIEMLSMPMGALTTFRSLSARRAWIEI